MNDDLAFPGTDDGRTVAEFDAQIKAHNALVAAPAASVAQPVSDADILNAIAANYHAAPAAPVAQGEPVAWRDLMDGEPIQVGDRILAQGRKWEVIEGESPAGEAYNARFMWPVQRLAAAPAAPVARPLKPEQVRDEYLRPCYASDAMYDWFEAGVRFAERKHGIGQGGA